MSQPKTCRLDDCDRPLCAKGLCRKHWERQHKTGTTDDPIQPRGAAHPSWKGDDVTYTAVHLRMSSGPRPADCAQCGATEGRFEWALRPDAPESALMASPEGYRYSADPAHYMNLCKPCHNQLDLTRDICGKGHRMEGNNVYVQPSNGKRFCVSCQTTRRRERTERDRIKAGAR